jgi:hypothetical protein
VLGPGVSSFQVSQTDGPAWSYAVRPGLAATDRDLRGLSRHQRCADPVALADLALRAMEMTARLSEHRQPFLSLTAWITTTKGCVPCSLVSWHGTAWSARHFTFRSAPRGQAETDAGQKCRGSANATPRPGVVLQNYCGDHSKV